MSIRVKCLTKLDDCIGEIWPIEMQARPIKGDLVRSASGKELKVVTVIHTTYKGRLQIDNVEVHPIIEVYMGR